MGIDTTYAQLKLCQLIAIPQLNKSAYCMKEYILHFRVSKKSSPFPLQCDCAFINTCLRNFKCTGAKQNVNNYMNAQIECLLCNKCISCLCILYQYHTTSNEYVVHVSGHKGKQQRAHYFSHQLILSLSLPRATKNAFFILQQKGDRDRSLKISAIGYYQIDDQNTLC